MIINYICRSYYFPYDPHHHSTFIATGKIAHPKYKIEYLDIGPQAQLPLPYAEDINALLVLVLN